ncbi:MAG TPA: pyridoxamine 5'-phosphate oxidase family protein [Acidimicrobiales bacterium]|nr:pyridoxamine 5'-phosphate oxidase family protein [Acidimicrobiales bacterium]
MTRDDDGLEAIGREECIELLRHAHIGRVATSIGALPVVLPVAYVIDGDAIVFAAGEHTQLAAGARNNVVAFEVDHVCDDHGWSVLATGHAHVVADPERVHRLRLAGPKPWVANTPAFFLEIVPELLTGRRMSVVRDALSTAVGPA